MGFSSFLTQDTDRSIANRHSSRKTFTVYMKDDKGNVWKETAYDGYMNFGGKDFFELTANMNGVISDSLQVEMHGEDEEARCKGIDMFFSDDCDKYIYPSLSASPDFKWTGEAPVTCPDQGYFYPQPRQRGYFNR